MKPLDIQLEDEAAERVRRSHRDAILELQAGALADPRIIQGVELANGVPKTIAHGLGRKPTIVITGVPRGAVAAGYLVESARDARVVILTANGYGATITVDLAVA